MTYVISLEFPGLKNGLTKFHRLSLTVWRTPLPNTKCHSSSHRIKRHNVVQTPLDRKLRKCTICWKKWQSIQAVMT